MTARKVRTFDGVDYGTELVIDGRRATFVTGHDQLGYVHFLDEQTATDTVSREVWLSALTDVREVSR